MRLCLPLHLSLPIGLLQLSLLLLLLLQKHLLTRHYKSQEQKNSGIVRKKFFWSTRTRGRLENQKSDHFYLLTLRFLRLLACAQQRLLLRAHSGRVHMRLRQVGGGCLVHDGGCGGNHQRRRAGGIGLGNWFDVCQTTL